MRKQKDDINNDIGNEIEADNASESATTPFICDICSRSFPTENSLRMHMLRSHKISPSGPREAPPHSIEITAPEIPDALTQLYTFLRDFGLSERDASGVLRYMGDYSLDNLIKLNEGLRDMGLPLNRRKLLIESWANRRSIPIPPNLIRELGINPTPSPNFYFPEQPKREDLSIFDYLLKWESLKKEVQPQPQVPQQDTVLAHQITELQQQIAQMQQAHQQEVEALKEEIRRKEKESIEKQIQSLEEQIRRLEESTSTREGYRQDEYRLISDALREIAKKEPVDKVLTKLPEILTLAYGIPQEKLQQQAHARSGLLQILKERGLTVPS